MHQVLNGQKLHEISIERWEDLLQQGFAATNEDDAAIRELAKYLGDLLGGH